MPRGLITQLRSAAARTRSAWGIFDQVLSSLTNFALTILVAHSVSAQAFGAFTIVMGSFLFGTMLMRSITSEPALVLYAGAAASDRERRSQDAMGATVVTGAALGMVLSAASMLFTGDLRSLFLLFGLSLPGLLLQDNVRYLLINAGRARAACLNDACYAVVEIGAAGGMVLSGHAPVFLLALAWALPGNVFAAVGVAQVGVTPRLAGIRDWYRDHKRFWIRFFVEAFSSQGGTYVVLYVLAGTSGLVASGSLRAAETLFKPASVLTSGMRAALIPELSRRRGEPGAIGRACMQVAVSLLLLTAIFGLPMVLLPSSIGTKILGASWAGAEPLLPYVLLAQSAAVIAMAALIGLRGLADPKRSMRAQLTVSALQLSLGVAGGLEDGARGAAIGLAVAGLFQTVIWWGQLTAGIRAAAIRGAEGESAEGRLMTEVGTA